MDPAVELTSQFTVFEPRWSGEELVQAAMRNNPALNAAGGAVESARARVSTARAACLPTLSLSLDVNGWIQRAGDVEMLVQQRLGGRTLSPQAEAEIRERVRRENQGFPFAYNRQPLNASPPCPSPCSRASDGARRWSGRARRWRTPRGIAAPSSSGCTPRSPPPSPTSAPGSSCAGRRRPSAGSPARSCGSPRSACASAR